MDAEHISAAMRALPSEYRVVSVLYFVENLSYQEIAEIIDCPVGTVRSRLHRSRKILQKLLWRVAEEQGVVSKIFNCYIFLFRKGLLHCLQSVGNCLFERKCLSFAPRRRECFVIERIAGNADD